ncbi:MAG: hypothetical protein FJ090_02400 [Deltaproteobacteria bacterium]|nr:hypothetical protein [Deltaproteobacteria bacterium]
MAAPRWTWALLALPVLGGVLSVAAPFVFESRHIPAELRPGAQPLTPQVERELSCAVEAACGPLRAPVTLELGGAPELNPSDVMPPGYADCAAKHLGRAFGELIQLSPCEGG